MNWWWERTLRDENIFFFFFNQSIICTCSGMVLWVPMDLVLLWERAVTLCINIHAHGVHTFDDPPPLPSLVYQPPQHPHNSYGKYLGASRIVIGFFMAWKLVYTRGSYMHCRLFHPLFFVLLLLFCFFFTPSFSVLYICSSLWMSNGMPLIHITGVQQLDINFIRYIRNLIFLFFISFLTHFLSWVI